MKKTLILVCNSHIDPVWLWEWEEGLAETLSTFRVAVEFCENRENFIFCHNESLLYEWVEKYDPQLFRRIAGLVKAGRWYPMGGWYLQPDCNMILGESAIRQIITGKKYFREKFGKEPATALNLDSFGHSRGLVQLLVAAGYNSYLFCRPDKDYLTLPADTFEWIGFDGSSITAHRTPDHYNSGYGKAGEKITKWISDHKNDSSGTGLLLWGIGNHGGGPSRKDLDDIDSIKAEEKGLEIKHGIPEDFFSGIAESDNKLPQYKGDLNPFAIGCYTSMKSIKQPLYSLEHKFFTAEKLLALSAVSGKISYPTDRMNEALKEILFCQFHDALPGTSVEAVEKDIIARIGHASRLVDTELTPLLVATGNSLRKADPGEFPVMIINPHPFDVSSIVEIELQNSEPNSDDTMSRIPVVFDQKGEMTEVQIEKPACSINEDHRKKIVFRATVAAGETARYSCFLRDVPLMKKIEKSVDKFVFISESSKMVIDPATGFPSEFELSGQKLLGIGGMNFAVISDNEDPWGIGKKYFDGDEEYFRPMDSRQLASFAGTNTAIPQPVYVSEKGKIRTIVESLFSYNNSAIHVRYLIPTGEPWFDAEITVYWMEKDKILKWILPVAYNMNCIGRAISGITCCKHRKREFVFRDWLGMKNFEGEHSLSVCADGAYGYDIIGNSVRISLLRAPAYSAHHVAGKGEILPSGRAIRRMDQGVHTFRFRFIPGKTDEIIDRSFNNSDLFNNPLITRLVYPTGYGVSEHNVIIISDNSINLQSVKLSDSGDLVMRLLNPSKDNKKMVLELPVLKVKCETEIGPKSLKTIIFNKSTREFSECDLLERIKT